MVLAEHTRRLSAGELGRSENPAGDKGITGLEILRRAGAGSDPLTLASWCAWPGRAINRAMSWLPDSGWLRALDLRASTAAAVSLVCWAVFGLAEFDLLYLGVLPAWVRAVFAIIALLALALWLARVWDLALAGFRAWRRRRASLTHLDKLSASEAALLRHQVEKNEQTFSIAFYSPVAAGLRHKELLELSSNLGDLQGGHPHTIPDFVWAELRRRWPNRAQPETSPEDARLRLHRARAGHRR